MCILSLADHTRCCQTMARIQEYVVWEVAFTLGMKQVFSSPYYPWCNRHIENVHNFVKTCIWRHVSSELVLDEVAHIASAAYSFILTAHSKESAFFLIFGRDVSTLSVHLFNTKPRYIGND